MTGGTHIRAIDPEAAQIAPGETPTDLVSDPIELEEEWMEEESTSYAQRRWTDWIVPIIALSGMAGWTAFFGWAFQSEMLAGGTPQDWTGWIINWSVPILLLATMWLLAMRLSRREAARFGDVALALRQEAGALEARLETVNRELSLAREFLASQSRDLDSIGRVASERISTHAAELQSLIHGNGAQVEAIATVSDKALSNMSKLRDDLPVIANSARDVSNQLGQAGRTAHDQLDKLVAGFERLNQFGKASGQQVAALSGQIDSTLSRFETHLSQIEQIAESRFAAMADKSDAFRIELDGREVDALAAMRARADELRDTLTGLAAEFSENEAVRLAALNNQVDQLRESGEAVGAALSQAQEDAVRSLELHKERLFSETAQVVGKIDQLDQHAVAAARRRIEALNSEAQELDDALAARSAKFAEDIARRQQEFDLRETQASEVLAQRLANVDELLSERSEAQIAQLEKLLAQGREVSTKAEELNQLLAAVTEHAQSTRGALDQGLGDMAGKLATSRNELNQTSATLAELTEAGIRLLEIIQSGARESREALPQAIKAATATLAEVEERAIALKGTVDSAHERSSGLSDYLIKANDAVAEAGSRVEAFEQSLAQSTDHSLERIAHMQSGIRALEEDSDRVAQRAGSELQAAIAQLEDAARQAFSAIESGTDDRLNKLAQEIGARASEAIELSLRSEGAEAIERLELASAKASSSSRETAMMLRDQLAKVNELAVNLEQRVARAREQAQEQVDNDFARRMALITESLHSNSIDIAKGLSQDVTDTAWASYLKGDRGIFTRRAVRLVDNAEAREIMDLYENDDGFREHVSRYIHDFEAMLRSVLSTRDGNALGVTLLSSDMGKLYVALAQSIERLRD